ncbi:MAG TPA: hypothetical protein VMU33_06490 [Burkholderiaceae bacterium]|nr:hypothetical protein [Burkholderiaceae bacterium]
MTIDVDLLAQAALGSGAGAGAQELPVDSRANLQRAVSVLLSIGRRRLDFADRDLSRFDLTLKTHVDRLEQILLSDRLACVRILVDDTAWLDAHAARLKHLQRTFSHCLRMRQSAAEDPVGDDAFAVVDAVHGLALRPGELVAGSLWLNSPRALRPWRDSFDRRWDAASHDLAVFALGL